MNQKNKIIFLGTYPPRLCGIATFTQDLSMALAKVNPVNLDVGIASLTNEGQFFNYPSEVIYKITAQKISDYLEVAKKINADNSVKGVSIQHEYKIFGSSTGENLIPFLDALKKQKIITLHSVPYKPRKDMKKALQLVISKSDKVVVMAKKAKEILQTDYAITDDKKIMIIPHGIHDAPFVSQSKSKKKKGYKGKVLLVSFGFLRAGKKKRSSGRGYEDVIEALPEIVKKFPNVLYLILGDTHPVVFQQEGDKYYQFLRKRVSDLGMDKHVKFIKRYLPLPELLEFLQAADIYICSNLNPAQITSGTLVYALGSGRAVISTPFEHAKEIISRDNGGLLVKFGDPSSISDCVLKILSNPMLKKELEFNAYKNSRCMTWNNVAKSYYDIFFPRG